MTSKLNHYLVDDLSRLGEIGLECLSTSTSVNCTEVPPPRVCMISPCKVRNGKGERGGREGARTSTTSVTATVSVQH